MCIFFRNIVNVSLCVLLGMFGVGAFAEQIYRWQDADGTWKYSQTPPANQKAEKLQISSPAAISDRSNSPAPGVNTEIEKGTSTPTVSPEIQAEEDSMRKKNCENARKNLNNLSQTGRIRYKDEKTGEITYLSEAEKQEWMNKSRQEIQQYCH